MPPWEQLCSDAPIIDDLDVTGIEKCDSATKNIWNQLMHDFKRNGIEEDDWLTTECFLARIQKSARCYDSTALQLLYKQGQSDAPRTGREYARIYAQKENELRHRVKKLQDQLHELSAFLESTEASLRRLEASDKISGPSRTAEESTLTVQIESFQILQQKTGDNNGLPFLVRLDCQLQEIETPTATSRADLKLTWNTLVSFTIEDALGDLSMTLYRGQTEEGITSIAVRDLADQRKHEIDKTIEGEHLSGVLRVTCQWIHSRKLLYQSLVREFSNKKSQCEDTFAQVKWEWEALSRPFGVGRPSAGEILVDLASVGPQVLSASIEGALRHMQLSSFQKALQYAVVISLVLACVSSYARSMFLDLSIACFGLWCNFDGAHRWNAETYNYVLIAIVISWFVDISWMLLFFADDENSAFAAMELGLRAVTKFFSLINFLWKVMLFLLFWKCRYDLRLLAAANYDGTAD